MAKKSNKKKPKDLKRLENLLTILLERYRENPYPDLQLRIESVKQRITDLGVNPQPEEEIIEITEPVANAVNTDKVVKASEEEIARIRAEYEAKLRELNA